MCFDSALIAHAHTTLRIRQACGGIGQQIAHIIASARTQMHCVEKLHIMSSKCAAHASIALAHLVEGEIALNSHDPWTALKIIARKRAHIAAKIGDRASRCLARLKSRLAKGEERPGIEAIPIGHGDRGQYRRLTRGEISSLSQTRHKHCSEGSGTYQTHEKNSVSWTPV